MPATTIDTPTIAPPPAYVAIRERLDKPRRRVLTDADLAELLHPHSMPDGSDWPAPNITSALMPMGHKQRLICALTAAEKVIHRWDDWEDDEKPIGPREGILAAWRFVESGNREIVSAIHRQVHSAYHYARFDREEYSFDGTKNAALYAVTVVQQICQLVLDPMVDRLDSAASAVHWAAYLERYLFDSFHNLEPAFLLRWWVRCRCRLAVADALTADIEWAPAIEGGEA